VNRYQSALVGLFLTAAIAAPCAAQQASSTPQVLPDESCAECFAYLEFPPSLEPESYAMRGETRLRPETPKSLPSEGEPNDRLRKQTAGRRHLQAVTAHLRFSP
jgi:hypothetical protein